MAICAECGREVDKETLLCSKCADKMPLSQSPFQVPLKTSPITEEEYRLFIGKNADEYLARFKRFNVDGTDRFSVIWHWPAFLVPFFWCSYRGLYGSALVSFSLNFLVFLIPFIGFFISNIVFGLIANYIYYKHCKKKIVNIKGLQVSSDIQRVELTRAGGVSRESVVIPIAAVIVVAGIVAAIVIPQLTAIRRVSFSSAANADLRSAASAQEAYFVDAKCYSEALGRITGSAYGFFPSQKVTVTIIGASTAGYTMSSYHASGGKTWSIAGPGGSVTMISGKR